MQLRFTSIDREGIDDEENMSTWRTSLLRLSSVGDSEHSVGETVPTKRIQITPRNVSAPHSCCSEAPMKAHALSHATSSFRLRGPGQG
jgi:hypothetical protein